MAEETTNPLRSYNLDLDNICAGVMPDSWEGHARIAIRESEHIPESIEEKAIGKALKLSDDKGTTPKREALQLIKALKQKQNE